MFKKFFEKRIQKDISKLEEARKKCILMLQSKGLSENEITQVESTSYKKASIGYVDNPNIQAALHIYFESLKKEALKIGYDVA